MNRDDGLVALVDPRNHFLPLSGPHAFAPATLASSSIPAALRSISFVDREPGRQHGWGHQLLADVLNRYNPLERELRQLVKLPTDEARRAAMETRAEFQVLTPAERQLILEPEYIRLAGIRQMSVCWSTWGSLQHQNRLEHSVLVMMMIGAIAERFQLPPQTIAALRLAGLSHDLGHPPFNHAGERVIHSFPNHSEFHHEHHGMAKLMKSGAIQRAMGPLFEQVVAALEPKSDSPLAVFVTEIDRLSYLVKDYLSGPFGAAIKKRAVDIVGDYIENISKLGTNELIYARREPIHAMIAARQILLQEVSIHPLANLATAHIKYGVQSMIQSGAMTITDFMNLTESRVLKALPPETSRILKDGADQHYVPSLVMHRSELSSRGIALSFGDRHHPHDQFVTPAEAKSKVGLAIRDMSQLEFMLRSQSPTQDFYMTLTPPYDHHWMGLVEEGAPAGRPRLYSTGARVEDDRQFLVVWIPKTNADAGQRMVDGFLDWMDAHQTTPGGVLHPSVPVDRLRSELPERQRQVLGRIEHNFYGH